jgi:phage/plasmid-associated DNA primase
MSRSTTTTTTSTSTTKPVRAGKSTRAAKGESPLSYIPSFSNGPTVSRFLRSRKAVSHMSQQWSLRTTIVPLATYMLNRDDDEADFFEAYRADRALMGDSFMAGLQEKAQSEWPVVVKVHRPDYTLQHVEQAVAEIQEVLSDKLSLDDRETSALDCYVLEYKWDEETDYQARHRQAVVVPEMTHGGGRRKGVNTGGGRTSARARSSRSTTTTSQPGRAERSIEEQLLRDTFVLHFPGIFMSAQDIELFLYPSIHKKLQSMFGYGEWSRPVVMDLYLLNNPHTLYGSKDNEVVRPMRVTSVYDDQGDQISLVSAVKGYTVYRSLRVSTANVELTTPVTPLHLDVALASPTPSSYHTQCESVVLDPKDHQEADLLLPEVLSIHRRHRKLHKVDHQKSPTDLNALTRDWVTCQAMFRWCKAHHPSKFMGLKDGDFNGGRLNMKAQPSREAPRQHRHIQEAVSKSEDEIKAIEAGMACSKERPAGLLNMLHRKRVNSSSMWKAVVSIVFDLYGGSDLGLTRLIQFTAGGDTEVHKRGTPWLSNQSDFSEMTDEDYGSSSGGGSGGRGLSTPLSARSPQVVSTNTTLDTIPEPEDPDYEDTEWADDLEDPEEFNTIPLDLDTDSDQDEKAPTNRRRRALRSHIGSGSGVGSGSGTGLLGRTPMLSPELRCLWAWHRHQPERRHTLASLEMLCRMDSTLAYQQLLDVRMDSKIKQVLSEGERAHRDVATLVHMSLKDEYVCVNTRGNGNWYHYWGHRWHLEEDGAKFVSTMVDTLDTLFRATSKRWRKQLIDMQDMHDDAQMNRRARDQNVPAPDYQALEDQASRIERMKRHMLDLDKMITKIKETPYAACIATPCRALFLDTEFIKKLDSNPKTLGFNNGVFDLTLGQRGRFRPGHPDDFITKTTRYDWPKHIRSWSHRDVMMVKDHFAQVFPDKLVREYVLEFCGSLLSGGNPDKVVMVFNGFGHNSKSVTNNLLCSALGDYATILPCSVLTGKRAESNAATPEMAQLPGIRYVIFNEPEKDEFVNAGKVKEFSGNDPMYARALFTKGFEFVPMFKMCIACNDTPRFNTDDPAIWARVRKIMFESLFDNSPEILNKTFEQQWADKTFPRDPYLNEKLPSMAPAMMWIMAAYWGKIMTLGRDPEPLKVIQATQQYRIANDPVDLFLRSNVTTTRRRLTKDKAGNLIAGSDGNDGSFIEEGSQEFVSQLAMGHIKETTFNELFERYKKWYGVQGLSKKTPVKLDTMASFVKFYGEPHKKPGTAAVEWWPWVYLKNERPLAGGDAAEQGAGGLDAAAVGGGVEGLRG